MRQRRHECIPAPTDALFFQEGRESATPYLERHALLLAAGPELIFRKETIERITENRDVGDSLKKLVVLAKLILVRDQFAQIRKKQIALFFRPPSPELKAVAREGI